MKGNIQGKTAFISGASSGIGRSCAEKLAELGVHLVIAARRFDRLTSLAKELEEKYKIHCYPYSLDIRNKDQIQDLVASLKQKSIEIDLVINNSGLAISVDLLQDGSVDNWDTMIDTNIKGLLYITRAFLPSMIQRNQGHIVNIGSVAGRSCYKGGNVYCATKYAVRAISSALRIDLFGTEIRISEIAPGAVETEFSQVRLQDEEKAKKVYAGYEPLTPLDIAEAVEYCVTRPAHVNISEVVLYPQAQTSVLEIHRKNK